MPPAATASWIFGDLMPWHVVVSSKCPSGKPWAVIKDSDGSVEGCHPSREAANRQMAALYAAESNRGTRMATKHAVYDAQIKAGDGTAGTFSAMVAVYGNVDLQGDRIVEGAFDRSIKEWQASGDPIPVIWSHNWADPAAHIGYVDPNNMESTPEGLKVTGRLDVEEPFAGKVHRLMKERRVKQLSFAYDVRDEKLAKDGANELLELGHHRDRARHSRGRTR